MGKNLVIVESPAKAKTINKILGKDYVVKACMGHVRDLPQKQLGVDIENGFTPQYVSIKGKEKVLKELKAEAAKSKAIYLAPDPDREGEAIAWHLLHELVKDPSKEEVFRVTYNEITAAALKESFSNPGRIDMNRVDSQQARRVLDRIVGYQVSPLLWRRIKGGSSAGRVQSVALRLVCERENLITSFVPEEFWIMGASVKKQVDPQDPFNIKLAKIDDDKAEITSGEQADKIRKDLEGRDLKVSDIIERKLTRKAQPPYITSTLQQAGSRFFSFTPSRTMRIAQNLYEGVDFGDGPTGLITYMRTDSVSIAKQAQDEARTYIDEKYGADYIPDKPNSYKSRGSAQEAHEAIRPTDVNRTPDAMAKMLKPEELKLYRIIWERFVASQMAPAKIAQKTVEIEAAGTTDSPVSYLFRVSASEVTFPGYMKVTGDEEKKKAKKEKENAEKEGSKVEEAVEKLPPLEKGETVDLLEWLSEQKFTQPPGRYTEASLVRALEENGVGRPSTYASILSTLQDRSYVEKEKRSLRPTELGSKVCAFLVEHLDELFNVAFTANMEESLDKIENGTVEWTKMLGEFYSSFEEWIKKVKGPDAKPELVQGLLDATKDIQEWGPEVKRGKRTYSDKKFVDSVQTQLDKGEKAISNRQLDALKKLLCRYHEQLPGLPDLVEPLGLAEALAEAKKPVEPPRETSQKKLELLETVTFAEAKKVGKRTYDDAAFSDSLRQQVVTGKRLSVNQIRYLDKLVVKYSDQIPEFESLKDELELEQTQEPHNEETGPLLELFQSIKEWKPAVMRGKREWDDKKFYDSLSTQFKERKELSFRQVASLKKMAKRYADQFPNYDQLVEQYGLPERKKKKAAAE